MLASAALFAAGTAAALLLQCEPPVRVLSLEPLPAMTLDLRDVGVRRFFGSVTQAGRTFGRQSGKSLFYSCWPSMEDTYAVSLWYSAGQSSYLEIRRNGASPEATALYWREYDFRFSPAAAERKLPLVTSRGQQPVSAADFAAIEAAFLALTHDRIEAIRDFGATDTDTVVLEFCRSGNYGVFARTRFSLDPQGEPVIALATQMRAAAGLPPDEPNNRHGYGLR